jgi:hypothetical protein
MACYQGKRILILAQMGWAGATAKGAAHTGQGLMRQRAAPMVVVRAPGCHAAAGDPSHRTRGPRGEWQDRRLGEPGRSMLTRVWQGKKVLHRGWASVQARLACTMAACTILVQWHGFQPSASGFVPLSMAALSL